MQLTLGMLDELTGILCFMSDIENEEKVKFETTEYGIIIEGTLENIVDAMRHTQVYHY